MQNADSALDFLLDSLRSPYVNAMMLVPRRDVNDWQPSFVRSQV